MIKTYEICFPCHTTSASISNKKGRSNHLKKPINNTGGQLDETLIVIRDTYFIRPIHVALMQQRNYDNINPLRRLLRIMFY